MDVRDKVRELAASARFDACGFEGPPTWQPPKEAYVFRAARPNGGFTCLLKVLLTNVCVNDCAYCANRVGRDCPRSAFKPDELARVFTQMHQRGLVQGLFLSSGIAGNANRSMSAMVDTVEIIRRRYRFNGYIHLKILPGATFDVVEAGCRLATRISVNMEAPTAGHLARLSARKDILQGIIEPMHWVKRIVGEHETLVPAGQTTQFVVGAAGESDGDLLKASANLYKDIGLRRVYFSAFKPVDDTPLEGHEATPPTREHRLYQADWLLRVYGFSADEVELALSEDGRYSLAEDPKATIAARQPWRYPLDVNKASYEELLRVPGIGPTSAQRIVDVRKEHSIDSLAQLRKMRVGTGRAAGYIWFKGMLREERQLSFLPQLEEAARPVELAAA